MVVGGEDNFLFFLSVLLLFSASLLFCLSPLSFASAKESGKEKQRQNGCLRPFCLPTHKNVTIILNFSFQKIVEHFAAENWESERRKKKEERKQPHRNKQNHPPNFVSP